VPKFNLDVPHTLSAEEAKSRLQRFSDSLQSKMQDQVKEMEQSWEGDALSFGFKTFGIKIQGRITVHDDRLAVEGDLPFSAMMFKGKIEGEINKELSRLVK